METSHDVSSVHEAREMYEKISIARLFETGSKLRALRSVRVTLWNIINSIERVDTIMCIEDKKYAVTLLTRLTKSHYPVVVAHALEAIEAINLFNNIQD